MGSVQDLQHMLDQISRLGGILRRVPETGTFDEATLEAVMLFQRDFLPPVTGVVDQAVWDGIMRLYSTVLQQHKPPITPRIFSVGAEISSDSPRYASILVVQAMAAALSPYVSNFLSEEINGVFSDTSRQNVLCIQALSDLQQTGILDTSTWNIWSRIFEAIITRNAFTQMKDAPPL